MRKEINFPPYTEAEIKAINEDGSILCNLFGDNYKDTDICFPADSAILSLTEQEREEYRAWQQAQEALLPEQMPEDPQQEYSAGNELEAELQAEPELEPGFEQEPETEPTEAAN